MADSLAILILVFKVLCKKYMLVLTITMNIYCCNYFFQYFIQQSKSLEEIYPYLKYKN